MEGLPPPNWYVDPNDDGQWRYWDGQAWTDHFAPRAPVPPPPDLACAAPPTVIHEIEQVEVVEAVVTSSQLQSDGALASVARGFFAKREKHKILAGRDPSIAKLLAALRREPPRHPLDEQVEVAGETYHVKGIKRVFAEVGMPIATTGSTLEDTQCTLVPEPWNPHDTNAVAVVIGDHHVGYLPAELAVNYAAPLGRLASNGLLATGEARIWAKNDGGVVRARVTVLIPEADALQ